MLKESKILEGSTSVGGGAKLMTMAMILDGQFTLDDISRGQSLSKSLTPRFCPCGTVYLQWRITCFGNPCSAIVFTEIYKESLSEEAINVDEGGKKPI